MYYKLILKLSIRNNFSGTWKKIHADTAFLKRITFKGLRLYDGNLMYYCKNARAPKKTEGDRVVAP